MIVKNLAGQKIPLPIMRNTADNTEVIATTGVTVTVVKDGVSAVGAGTLTYDAGLWYEPTASETNANAVTIRAVKTGAYSVQTAVITQDYPRTAIPAVAAGSPNGLPVLDANSRVNSNVQAFGGTAGTFNAGRPEVNSTHWAGTAVGSAMIRANVLQFNGVSGTFSGGRPEVNASHWGGTAVATALVRSNIIQVVGANVTSVNDFKATGFAVAGDAMTLTSGERTSIAAAIWSAADRQLTAFGFEVALTTAEFNAIVLAMEAELANDLTGTALKQAIVDKLIENLPNLDDLSIAAIRTEMERAGGYLDLLITRITEDRAAKLDRDIATPTSVRTELSTGTPIPVNTTRWAGIVTEAILTNIAEWSGTEWVLSSKTLPNVAANAYKIGGWNADQFVHIGSGYLEFHSHVHGFSAEAITAIEDASSLSVEEQDQLLAAAEMAATFDTMQVGGVYTVESLANAPTGTGGGATDPMVLALMKADVKLDRTVTPHEVVWYEEGTTTELMRKQAFDRKNEPVKNSLQPLGSLTQAP